MPQDSKYEGHGDSSKTPTVSKGEFIGEGATYADLAESAVSVNSKTGHVGDGVTKAKQ